MVKIINSIRCKNELGRRFKLAVYPLKSMKPAKLHQLRIWLIMWRCGTEKNPTINTWELKKFNLLTEIYGHQVDKQTFILFWSQT